MSDGGVRGVWLRAGEWQGRAWLNGEEVTSRCRGVLMDGEHPVALELYRPWTPVLVVGSMFESLRTEIHHGDIRVQLQPRNLKDLL